MLCYQDGKYVTSQYHSLVQFDHQGENTSKKAAVGDLMFQQPEQKSSSAVLLLVVLNLNHWLSQDAFCWLFVKPCCC